MTLSDTINRMIERALLSSYIVSPRFDDYKITVVEQVENPDLEAEIKGMIQDDVIAGGATATADAKATPPAGSSSTTSTDPQNQKILNQKVESFDTGNVGQIQKMSTEQFSNVQQLAKDPFQFMIANVFKKLAKGAGVAAFATIFYAVVQLILTDLQKPGRAFDRKFKRDVRNEILTFTNEREQQQLRQGFKSVIITTLPFLRRSETRGQISGNLYNPTAIPENRLDPRREEPPSLRAQGQSGNQRNHRYSGS